MVFTISSKPEVLFGPGTSKQLGEKLKTLGCRKVLCVYDQGVEKAGIVKPVLEQLSKEKIEVVPFGDVLSDPPDTLINECAEFARAESVDGVVGIGGGSTLDTAKAVNVLLGNVGEIQQYFGPDIPHNPSKPLVLIPTTAGTASEITYVSVITNTKTNTKDGLAGPATIAKLAIVDPSLTINLPASITAFTGMDAFAHAMEAYTSKLNNPMSDTLSEKSMRLVADFLPGAVKDGNDMEARTRMSFACMIAGMSFNDAGPHFGHAFGQTLGSLFKVPHGIGCAIAQTAVIDVVVDVMPEKVLRIGELLGLKLDKKIMSTELAEVVSARISDFSRKIGIPTLKELGVGESDLENLAKGTMADGLFNLVPKQLEFEDVLKAIYRIYSD